MKIAKRLLLCMVLMGSVAQAAPEPESCRAVRLSDNGWTDIVITTAMARYLLSALGYDAEIKRLSLPDTFKELARGDLDAFLGNWLPSMGAELKPYTDEGQIETLGANLKGAKYTLAVPQYVYDAGVKTFADLAQHADQFDRKIYGIEPGNDGNQLIAKMIAKDAFGLGAFTLQESNEGGMLAQVKRKEVLKQWIVFLGWEPHPMNTRFKMAYLAGGDEYFGPNYGGATIYTTTRKHYTRECPNAGKLLSNLVFSLDMENQLMDRVLNERDNPRRAVREWLQQHPMQMETWLRGVNTHNGAPGLAAVKSALTQ